MLSAHVSIDLQYHLSSSSITSKIKNLPGGGGMSEDTDLGGSTNPYRGVPARIVGGGGGGGGARRL